VVLVDYRAGSKELVRPLEARGLEVVETELAFGDFAFEGKGADGATVQIGIEYKQLGELIQSMRSGRLEGHQLIGMRGANPGESPLYDFAYLLIEGEILYDKRNVLLEKKRKGWRGGAAELVPMHGTMNAHEFMKRMEVLHLCGGLNVRYAKDEAATVTTIEILYRTWTDKALDEHTSHLALYNPPPLRPVGPERLTYATLPGVGFELSGRVAEHFPTLGAAFAAPVSAWQEIEGIGVAKAETITAYIRRAHARKTTLR